MPQQDSFFLGEIADAAWQQRPGSSIILHVGAEALAILERAAAVARRTGRAVQLTRDELPGFYVQQVKDDGMDRLSGGVVQRFIQDSRRSPHPIPLPGEQMKHVLLLTDEYDELRASRRTVTPAGLFVVEVKLKEEHAGKAFAVRGGIALSVPA